MNDISDDHAMCSLLVVTCCMCEGCPTPTKNTDTLSIQWISLSVGGSTDTAKPQSTKYPAAKRSRFVGSSGEPVTTSITYCPGRFPNQIFFLSASRGGIVPQY